MQKYTFMQKLGEFLLVLVFLYAWFLVQYICIRPLNAVPVETIAKSTFTSSVIYALVIYGVFNAFCRKRFRPEMYLKVSIGISVIGFILWYFVKTIAETPASLIEYTSTAHLQLNGATANWLAIISDPLFLMPIFAYVYGKKRKTV